MRKTLITKKTDESADENETLRLIALTGQKQFS
jgi:hypothetical protein